MPNHKSCKKRMRTSAVQRLANRAVRSRLRAAVKELRDCTSKEDAQKLYPGVASMYDRAAQKHLIHPRNADRHKSRLARYVQGMA